jgi:hypothetical protein
MSPAADGVLAAERQAAVTLQGILESAMGGWLAHGAAVTLDRMAMSLRSTMEAAATQRQSGDAADPSLLTRAAVLEASPLLEAADMQLNDLERQSVGNEDSAENADIDWLDEEVIQQTAEGAESSPKQWRGDGWEGHAQADESNWPAPALQPFLDFDEDLSAAEGELEAVGGFAAIGGSAHGPVQGRLERLMQLEPFMDFDEGLGGAGDALEEGIASSGSTQKQREESDAGGSEDAGLLRTSQGSENTGAAGSSGLPNTLKNDVNTAVQIKDREMEADKSQAPHTGRSGGGEALSQEAQELLGHMEACAGACSIVKATQLARDALASALEEVSASSDGDLPV